MGMELPLSMAMPQHRAIRQIMLVLMLMAGLV
jgi:hypothetical protein